MPNICGTGPAVWGDFFPGEGALTDACSKYGKYFPWLQCIPGIF